MKYVSTRGQDGAAVDASRALMKGIAEDGGLYVPQRLDFKFDVKNLKDYAYAEMATEILTAYFSGDAMDIAQCAKKAYGGALFHTDEPVALQQVGQMHILELFHGRTAAFKDMALSILPYLVLEALRVEKINKRIVILTATSGDTGKSALAGFADVSGVDIIVFYPSEGVSEVQKRHMQSQQGANVHVVGIKGNFDDAQSAVKEVFSSGRVQKVLAEENKMLSSANSINIGRLFPQTVYYWYAYCALVRSGAVKMGEPVNFCVPTGNFGNILAGYYASRAGLPVGKFICASNENNVLTDFFQSGVYDKNRAFKKTIAPSMDILISSNLERLIYHLAEGDSGYVKTLMDQLRAEGRYEVRTDIKEKMDALFDAYDADEAEIKQAIGRVYSQHKEVYDTHTAAGIVAYEKYIRKTKDETPCVILSTASPYKFADSVLEALGEKAENSFEGIRRLCEKTGKNIHPALIDIDKAKILHPDVCDKTEIEDYIIRVLKEKEKNV